MENIKKFVIGGVIFNVEETALSVLNDFIEDISFKSGDKQRELEAQAADLLLLRLNERANYTTLQDITYMIKALEDTVAQGNYADTAHSPKTTRKSFFNPSSYFSPILELA